MADRWLWKHIVDPRKAQASVGAEYGCFDPQKGKEDFREVEEGGKCAAYEVDDTPDAEDEDSEYDEAPEGDDPVVFST